MSLFQDKSLGEIADKAKRFPIVDGPFGTQLHADEYVSEGVPVVRVSNLSYEGKFLPDKLVFITEKKAQKLVRSEITKDDLIIAKTGATIGKTALFPLESGIVASSCLKVTFDRDQVDPRYMLYLIMSDEGQRKILDGAGGSTRTTINITPLSNIKFNIPYVDYQIAAADVLSTIDQAITHTEALIAKYQRIKTGMMQDLLTRGIDEKGEIRDLATHKFKPSRLGMIPDDWDIEYLTQNITFPKGQVDPKNLPYRDWPLIAPDHIEQRTGRLLNIETAFEQGAISGKYVFHEGDVVYSKIRPYLRKAILAEFRGICSADMYPMRPGPNITSEFLFLILLSEHFSRFAESVSERSGFPKINRNELAEYQFALPKLHEQKMIYERVSALQKQEDSYQDHLQKYKRIKQGLLRDLLSGKVSVAPLIERGG